MLRAARNLCLVFAIVSLGCAQAEPAGGNPGSGGGTVTGAAGATGGGALAGAAGSPGSGGRGGSAQGGDFLEATSGSRLKAYWITGQDGSKQFNDQWWDSQLSIDCNFTVAQDGNWRCMPLPSYVGAIFFSDSGCTTPLFYTSCSTPLTTYVSISTTSGTGCNANTTWTLRQRGSQYTGSVYQGTPTSCAAANSTSTASYVLYTIGAAVDVTIFQQASRTHD